MKGKILQNGEIVAEIKELNMETSWAGCASMGDDLVNKKHNHCDGIINSGKFVRNVEIPAVNVQNFTMLVETEDGQKNINRLILDNMDGQNVKKGDKISNEPFHGWFKE